MHLFLHICGFNIFRVFLCFFVQLVQFSHSRVNNKATGSSNVVYTTIQKFTGQ